jgi:hypothetical protein
LQQKQIKRGQISQVYQSLSASTAYPPNRISSYLYAGRVLLISDVVQPLIGGSSRGSTTDVTMSPFMPDL